MKLSSVERWVVNSSVRRFVQSFYETPKFLKLGGRIPGEGKVLEIGCGQGNGIDSIIKTFNPSRIDGIDIDDKMIHLARSRVKPYMGDRNIHLHVGSVEEISFDDQSYDAVFSYGVLHHITKWEKSVDEVYRILRPGGKFYLLEFYKGLISLFFVQWLAPHPKKNRFNHEELKSYLEKSGFEVIGEKKFCGLWGVTVVQKK